MVTQLLIYTNLQITLHHHNDIIDSMLTFGLQN